ncbi:MAG TPA: hydantoinase/oxoprolinase family protein [Gaiellaceae bacterium]|nr:hydantoinase/oxoprolinase family protein [Gaiellaceae bacterium]
MGFRIAVDTGGTFSDVVLLDEDGELSLMKAPTTPDRMFDGISEALRLTGDERGLSLDELLGQTDVFVYGTTAATNAIITGRTARTAFLTTEGFPDTLVLREGGKLHPFDFRVPYPKPYVPRRLTFEVRERITSEGDVLVPLDRDRLRATLADVRAAGVEAVAVSLLWSIVNPMHEEAVAELLEEELPGVPYTLSHRLNPIIREYRRASSAAIDASLKPLMQRHLRQMRDDLEAAGFGGELLVVTSFGGVLTLEDVAGRPVHSVNSGPAMAPVAGKVYAGEWRNAIVCDMGGTSFDVSLIRDGYIKFTRETWLGGTFTGHMTGLSSVEVKSIGAGGGSIAWIDSGGLLRVGPDSAGAMPGPACYGHGGEEPTVTDAAVVLGYIDPDYFLGGRIKLDPDRAHEAIKTRVSERLGLGVEQAAYAILAVANEHMVGAIRDITINEGLDPRDSVIVSGGGAGGLAIARIADELGCSRVLVPRTAAALSACGGQLSDAVTEFSVSRRADTNRFDRDAVNEGLEQLDARLDEFFERLRVAGEARSKEFFVEARYPYQVWELDVPLRAGRFAGDADVAAMVEDFHQVHERVFAVKEPGQHVECVYWKGRATARLPKPALRRLSSNGSAAGPDRHRPAWFDVDAAAQAPIYLGASLAPGARVEGPAIVEEPTTTVVVYPDWALTVGATGDYLLERSGGSS